MAITTAFKVANNTASLTKTLPLFDMKEVESYGTDRVKGGYQYTNSTVGYTGDEVLTIKSESFPKGIGKLSVSTDKMATEEVVNYSFRLEIELVTDDSSNADFETVVDPIIVTLAVRHPKSDYIQASHILTAIGRLLSTAFPEAGTTARIAALMKGNSLITVD
jgi:hypothetical protein